MSAMASPPPLPPLPDHPAAIDDLAALRDTLADALDGGDVAALQIRLKDVARRPSSRAVDRAVPPIAQAARRGGDPQRPAGPGRASSAATASMSARTTPPTPRRAGSSGRTAWSASPATTAATWPWRRPRPAPTMSPSAPSSTTATKDSPDPRRAGDPVDLAGDHADPLRRHRRDHGGERRGPGRRRAPTSWRSAAGVWSHPQGPRAAVAALNAEIAKGVKARLG